MTKGKYEFVGMVKHVYVIIYNDKPLVNLLCDDLLVDYDMVLDDYSKKYGLDRDKLSLVYVNNSALLAKYVHPTKEK